MKNCVNIKSDEFIALLGETKLDALTLQAKISVWQTKHATDTFPTAPQLLKPEKNPYKGPNIKEPLYSAFSHINSISDILFPVPQKSDLQKITKGHYFFDSSKLNNQKFRKFGKSVMERVVGIVKTVDADMWRISVNNGPWFSTSAENKEKGVYGRIFLRIERVTSDSKEESVIDLSNDNVISEVVKKVSSENKSKVKNYLPTQTEINFDENGNDNDISIHRLTDENHIKTETEIFTGILAQSIENAIKDNADNVKLTHLIDAMISMDSLPEYMIETLNQLKSKDVSISLATDAAMTNKKGTDKARFIQIGENKTIIFNTLLMGESSLQSIYEAIVHEGIHSHVGDVYLSNKSFRDEIDRIYGMFSRIGGNEELKESYGMSSAQEFMAEIIANPIFARDLENIDFTLLDRIINAIIKYTRLNKIFPALEDRITSKYDAMAAKGEAIALIEDAIVNRSSYMSGYNGIAESAEIELALFGKKRSENIKRTSVFKEVSDIANYIIKGLEDRYQALKGTVGTTIESLNAIEKILENMDVKNSVNSVARFIVDMNDDINSMYSMVIEAKEFGHLSPEKLLQIEHDYINFIEPILQSTSDQFELEDSDSIREIMNSDSYLLSKSKLINPSFDAYDLVISYINEYTHHFGQIKSIYKKLRLEVARDVLKKNKIFTTTEDAESLLDYLEEMYVDTTALMVAAGQYSKSKIELLKILHKMAIDADARVESVARDMQSELSVAYSNLDKKGKGDIGHFLELNDNGTPTGYYVRELNYGKMYEKFKEEEQKIYDAANVKLEKADPENFTPLAAGEYSGIDEIDTEIRKSKNEWLDKNTERRFVKEYYELFEGISEEAFNRRKAIDDKIEVILNKVTTVEGNIDKSKLTADDVKEYNKLKRSRRNLSSPIDDNGEAKTGIDLQIAEELTNLSLKIRENVKYKHDYAAFNLEKSKRQKQVDLGEITQEDFDKWESANTKTEINQKFFDDLATIPLSEDKTVYDEAIKFIIDKIVGSVRNDDQEIVDEDLTSKARRVVDTLQLMKSAEEESKKKFFDALSQEERRIIQDKFDAKVARSGKSTLRFKDVAVIETTNRYKRLEAEAYERQEIEFRTQVGTEAERTARADKVIENFRSETHYYDKNIGEWKIKQYYTKIMPKDKKMISIVPNEQWSILDEESKWVNPKYNPKLADFGWQPKKELYDNSKAYNKIISDPDYKDVYDKIIAQNKASNELLGGVNKRNPYKTPMKSGGAAYRLLKSKGIKNKINNLFRHLFFNNIDDEGRIKQHDTIERSDGTVVRFIPIEHSRRLEDMNTLSRDLVSSANLYNDSAVNFNIKSKLLPEFLVVQDQISSAKLRGVDGKNANPGQANVNKAIRNIIDTYFYGAKESEKMAGKQGALSGRKVAKLTANAARILLLALNDIVIAANLTQTNIGLLLESAIGRYMDLSSYGRALGIFLYYLPQGIIDIGRMQKRSKLVQMMRHNGVMYNRHKRSKETVNGSIRRVYERVNLFAIHEMVGFYSAGMTVASTYQFNRIYRGEVYSKYQFMNKFYPDKKDKKEAMVVWNMAPTLWDAYEAGADGNIKLKEYKEDTEILNYQGQKIKRKKGDKIFSGEAAKSKMRIRHTIEHSMTKIDSMLNSETDGIDLARNAFTNLLLLMRGWMVVIFQDKVKARGMNYLTEETDVGHFRSAYESFNRFASAATNSKKIIEIYGEQLSVLEVLLKEFKGLTKEDEYAAKSIRGELAVFLMFAIASFFYIGSLDDDDDDDLKKQRLALFLRRMSFERGAAYNPTEILNLLDSPSAGTSVSDVLTDMYVSWMKPNKVLKGGPYKGMTTRQRAAWKMTPFRQLIERNDPRSKRKRLEQNNRIVQSLITRFFGDPDERKNKKSVRIKRRKRRTNR